jgi:hypothetical protein
MIPGRAGLERLQHRFEWRFVATAIDPLRDQARERLLDLIAGHIGGGAVWTFEVDEGIGGHDRRRTHALAGLREHDWFVLEIAEVGEPLDAREPLRSAQLGLVCSSPMLAELSTTISTSIWTSVGGSSQGEVSRSGISEPSSESVLVVVLVSGGRMPAQPCGLLTFDSPHPVMSE